MEIAPTVVKARQLPSHTWPHPNYMYQWKKRDNKYTSLLLVAKLLISYS